MPYKAQEARKEASRKSMERKRKGVNIEGLTPQGLTSEGTYFKDGVEMVPPAFVEGLEGKLYQSLPARPRYLQLSDNQVLDRAKQPRATLSGSQIVRMRLCNEVSFNYTPNKGTLPAL